MLPAIAENTVEAWGARIAESYGRGVQAVVETGRLLLAAKAAVVHGQWMPLVEGLPFSIHTAERMMRIADHPQLSNSAHAQSLPTSITTLDCLSRLDAAAFDEAREAGVISPDLERRTAQRLARGGLEAVIGGRDSGDDDGEDDDGEAFAARQEEAMVFGAQLWRTLFAIETPKAAAIEAKARAMVVASARWFAVPVGDLFRVDAVEPATARVRAHAARRAATYLLHTRCGIAQPKAGAVFGLEPSAVSRLSTTLEDYRDMPCWEATFGLIEQGADVLLRFAAEG